MLNFISLCCTLFKDTTSNLVQAVPLHSEKSYKVTSKQSEVHFSTARNVFHKWKLAADPSHPGYKL